MDLYPSKSSLLQPVDTYLLVVVIGFGILQDDYLDPEVLILIVPVVRAEGYAI